jgi:AAA family ATP:ADP antiporter
MKALNRMRLQFPELIFQRQAVLDLIRQGRNEYRLLEAMSNWLRRNSLTAVERDGAASDVLRLLAKAIRERAFQKLEKIFRLLALTYPPHDIYSAYYTCMHKPANRASAVEFLDNLLDPDFKQLVIPLIEGSFGSRSGRDRAARRFTTLNGILQALVRSDDPWLRQIAADLKGRLVSEPIRTDAR